MFKDLGNATKLNDMAEEAMNAGAKAIIENIKDYAIVAIHNEASEDVDYNNYLIIDGNGDKYYTGSAPFWNSFKSIWDEMSESDFNMLSFQMEMQEYKLVLFPNSNDSSANSSTCIFLYFFQTNEHIPVCLNNLDVLEMLKTFLIQY